jgi:hypothetical protein
MQIGDQSYVLGLFNTTSTDSNGYRPMDLSSLATGAAAASSATPPARVAPTPPWVHQETPAQAKANVQVALAGQPIVNEGAAQLDLAGASADYKKLFALYKALDTLSNIAAQAAGSKAPLDQKQLSKAFNSGLTEVAKYLGSSTFDKLRLADGAEAANATATLKTSKPATTYVTPPLTNSLTADVPAFAGNAQFNISIKRNSQSFNVPIDLSGLGTPRSLADVIGYINQQLSAAGVETRVATSKIPGQPQTITAGGSTVTLPPTSDQYAMKINIGTSETVSFSAPQTAGAVYVAQAVGDPDPDKNSKTNDSHVRNQLLKFQTDTTNLAAPPQLANQPNFVPGRVYANNLEPNIGAVRATQVGPDGSVYMLADVKGTTYGQSIQGTQDVAYMKYDSAGRLVFARTLGASSSASGLGLAVSSTGQVAISGSVTGALYGSTDGALNSGPTGAFSDQTDSFVNLYDSSGNELWTARRGSALQDQASQVAFSADGNTVYVAGQAQGVLPGAGGATIGGYDGYIEAFTTTAKGTPQATFTQTFGTTGQDSVKGMVVDGNTLVTASVESGHAILRNYDISSGAPVLSASRDLGDLQGGNITGLALNGGQVVVAGTTSNGALAAGTVTRNASGGSDAFAAQVSESLASGPGDAIAYYGGTGDDKATSLAVSGGQVWIGGQAGTDLPGQPVVGNKDGFIASLNISTGAIVNSQRFTGKDGMAVPTSIAVDTTGASILDRLGLPKGAIGVDTSQQLTAQSSLRVGEQFTIATSNSPPVKITIDKGETLDTLATKIQRASGFQALAKVTTVSGQRSLKIVPANGTNTVTLGAGAAGKNALDTLGLPEGLLHMNTTKNGVTMPADGGSKIYGLGLSSTLNIDSAAQISHARAVVGSAMGVVRRAYQDLVTAATPKTAATAAAAAGKTGKVPQYLTNQLANLHAGLARLTGGNTGSVFNIRTTA